MSLETGYKSWWQRVSLSLISSSSVVKETAFESQPWGFTPSYLAPCSWLQLLACYSALSSINVTVAQPFWIASFLRACLCIPHWATYPDKLSLSLPLLLTFVPYNFKSEYEVLSNINHLTWVSEDKDFPFQLPLHTQNITKWERMIYSWPLNTVGVRDANLLYSRKCEYDYSQPSPYMGSQLWVENTADSWTTWVWMAQGHLHMDFKPVLFKD